MKRSDLTEFEVEDEGFKLKIKRASESAPMVNTVSHAIAAAPVAAHREAAPAPPAQASAAPAPAAASNGAEEAGVTYVKSPMVGTFYRSPSPESPSFVDVNSKVDTKSVVCIIEAMKIMNEIQAEAKGTVVEVLVENGQPVEYGQRLFKIKQG